MNRNELETRLRAIREPAPPPELRTRLESGIPDLAERPERPWGRGSWTMIKVGAVTASAAALVLFVLWTGFGPGGAGVAYAAALDPVLEATGSARAVHVVLNMLTREGEDFGYVNLDGAPRTVEAWIEWPAAPGDTGRARVEKTDRVYVFDGEQSIFYHPQRAEAYKGSAAFGHELFWPAAWVRQIRNRPGDDVEVLSRESTGAHGRLLIREPRADAAPRSPAFLGEFDRETEVVWDLETNLLTELRRWVLVDGQRRLFSEIVSIEYLPAIEDEVFVAQLPDDVRWGGIAEAPLSLLELGPRAVAERLFDAAMRGDREQLELFCGSPSIVDYMLEDRHRPTEVLFIGEPFRAGEYPGVYVPYQVRFGSGWRSLKSHNLALRNDNSQHRWVLDGGI